MKDTYQAAQLNSEQGVNRPSLLFFAAWWPSSEAPGAGIFIREHALALLPYFDVHVIHLSVVKDTSVLLYRIDHGTEEDDGLHVHRIEVHMRIRRFGLHDAFVQKGYASLLTRLRKDFVFDGYCINVRSHLTKLVPELPALRNLNFMLIEHFSYYHRVLPGLDNQEKAIANQAIMKWFANPNLKQILAVSNDLKDVLVEQFQLSSSRISLISNVSHPAFDYLPGFEAPKDHLRFICVGLWEEPKRLDLLFDALHGLSEQQGQIVIEVFGAGSQIDTNKHKAASIGPAVQVNFHGFQPKETIAGAMQQAHALIHPTDAENAPTVIAEAQCCGLPVLSMAVNGIPEMATEENGVLVLPGDPKALRDGLETLITHLATFNRAQISEQAKRKYSRSAVGKLLNDQLIQLMS
ncbi:MAG: glycosyltransferase family 4 protein [Flavobacteriales bacterium]|nr:glycosyltransferase family 4 protein [Flavobacteriales bacterium]